MQKIVLMTYATSVIEPEKRANELDKSDCNQLIPVDWNSGSTVLDTVRTPRNLHSL